jgi:hypothetical protein
LFHGGPFSAAAEAEVGLLAFLSNTPAMAESALVGLPSRWQVQLVRRPAGRMVKRADFNVKRQALPCPMPAFAPSCVANASA